MLNTKFWPFTAELLLFRSSHFQMEFNFTLEYFCYLSVIGLCVYLMGRVFTCPKAEVCWKILNLDFYCWTCGLWCGNIYKPKYWTQKLIIKSAIYRIKYFRVILMPKIKYKYFFLSRQFTTVWSLFIIRPNFEAMSKLRMSDFRSSLFTTFYQILIWPVWKWYWESKVKNSIFRLRPSEIALKMSKTSKYIHIFRIRIPCCGYSKLVSRDAWHTGKGIRLIQLHSPEKTSKMLNKSDFFRTMLTEHVLDIFRLSSPHLPWTMAQAKVIGRALGIKCFLVCDQNNDWVYFSPWFLIWGEL